MLALPLDAQTNVWVAPVVGLDIFLTNFLQISIHQSSYHLKLYELDMNIINNPLEAKVNSDIKENTTKVLESDVMKEIPNDEQHHK